MCVILPDIIGKKKRGSEIPMSSNNQNQGQDKTLEIDIIAVLRVLLRKCYWLILAAVVAGIGTYFAISVFVEPKYESRVSFYVYNSEKSASESINSSDLQAASSLATTYSKILASNSMLDAVLKNLGSDANLTREQLSSMTSVSVVSSTQLLEVVITSTNAEFACRVAQAFANSASGVVERITKAGGVEVVDQPDVAKNQSSPRTLFDSAIGALVGVMIVALIIIIRMMADTVVYVSEDILDINDVTILGEIPMNSGNEGAAAWEVTDGGEVRYDVK